MCGTVLLLLLLQSTATWSTQPSSPLPRAVSSAFPQFVDLSPCGCDLTRGRCDTYCCCDKECPESMRNHTCTGGPFGGENAGKVPPMRNCSRDGQKYEHVPKFGAEGRELLCVYDQHSSYLGNFYDNARVVKSATLLDRVIANRRERHFEADRLNLVPGRMQQKGRSSEGGYISGDEIMTTEGVLRMPMAGAGFAGRCALDKVRFLRDNNSSCVVHVDEDACDAKRSPFLSARSFLRQEKGGGGRPAVFASGKGDEEEVFAQVRVRYHSTNRFNSKAEAEEQMVDSAERLLNAWSRDQSRDSNFVEASESGNLRYDSSSAECRNVVVRVEYVVVWAGKNVVAVNADIHTADVKVGSSSDDDGRRIWQLFSVTHAHTSAISSNSTSPRKSGNPGYVRGRPLISGHLSESSKGDDQAVKFSAEHSGMYLWSTDSTSLCRRAHTRDILFGEDVATGCLLQLQRSNFTDCDGLRNEVETIFSGMIKSTVVGKGGDPNAAEEADFVNILRLTTNVTTNETENSNNTRNDEDGFPFLSCWISNELQVRVMHSRAEARSSGPIDRINAVSLSKSDSLWRWRGCTSDVCFGSFELRLSVRFEEIPLRWPFQNTSRFWTEHWSAPCRDGCWRELAHPFTAAQAGWEVSYVAQWGIILAGGAGFVLVATRQYL